MQKTYLGYLFMILSAGSFALMSLLSKMAYDIGLSVPALMLIQSVLTQIMLGFMYLREPKPVFPRPRVPGWELAIFALSGGAAAVTISYAFYYLSLSLATILLFTYPAFVTIFAWLILRQRPTAGHLSVLALTLVGALLTSSLPSASSDSSSPLGIGLALVGAAFHGLYMVMGERVAPAVSAVQATMLARGTVLCVVLLSVTRVWPELSTIPWQGWLVAVLSAAVGGVAPFLFLNRGIALIGANLAAIVSVVELPFALALGLTFQGDLILPLQWLGTLLIGTAVIIGQWGRQGSR